MNRPATVSAASRVGLPSQKTNWLWYASVIFAQAGQLLFVGILLDAVLFPGSELDFKLRLIAISLVLLAIIRSQVWFLLLAIQLSLFLTEPEHNMAIWDLGAIAYCSLAVAVILYACVAQTSARTFSRKFACWVAPPTEFDSAEHWLASPNDRTWRQDVSTLCIELAAVLGIVLCAVALLNYLPLTDTAQSEWLRRSLGNRSLLWPGPTIVVVAFGIFLIAREIAWRQLTPAQARTYLRSEFFSHHQPDLKLFIRRRLKRARSGSKKLM